MESFFEFIFANFFIVIIIVAAIINFLNKGRQNGRADEQHTDQQKPSRPPVERQDRRVFEKENPTMQGSQQEAVTKTIQEQRQDQYERLRSQYQASKHKEANKVKSDQYLKELQVDSETEKSTKVNMNIEKKLTPEGLVESVIMAEVLGPPRALNPYRNIAVKRNQR